MTKFSFPLFSLLFSLYTFGQSKPATFPKEIVSTKTTQHKNIPGTNVFIIPPIGFGLDDKESTFRFQDSIFINATTMLGISFYQNSKTFTKEKFVKKGKGAVEFSNSKINGLPAKIAITKEGTDIVYQIMTGTSTFTTMILASYPSKNETIGKTIKKSLETIYCDKTKKVDPFYSSFFRIDDSKSNFKLTRSNGSDYFYTNGGIIKKSYDNEPYVIVSSVPVFLGIDLKTTANDELADRDITKDSTIQESLKYIGGNQTYERIVFGKLDGKIIMIYQYLIGLNPSIVFFQGFADNDFAKNKSEFRKLCQTIKQQE